MAPDGISYGFKNYTAATDPYEIAAKAAKIKKEKEAKRFEEQRQINTSYLNGMAGGITTLCNNFWNTKYAINDIDSLQYHLRCNPNTDSSVYAKVAALKAQQPILLQKLEEFKNDRDKKDSVNLETNVLQNKGLDRTV